jgi:hypothetical protein
VQRGIGNPAFSLSFDFVVAGPALQDWVAVDIALQAEFSDDKINVGPRIELTRT